MPRGRDWCRRTPTQCSASQANCRSKTSAMGTEVEYRVYPSSPSCSGRAKVGGGQMNAEEPCDWQSQRHRFSTPCLTSRSEHVGTSPPPSDQHTCTFVSMRPHAYNNRSRLVFLCVLFTSKTVHMRAVIPATATHEAMLISLRKLAL